jgi:hypothetical protein
MKNLKIYEDYNSPPEYEDGPDPEEIGREINYPFQQRLFKPLFVTEEQPGDYGPGRSDNGQPEFDIIMDKTPESALWAVYSIDDVIPDSYKMLWNTADGEQYVQDEEAVTIFATDEFRAGRFYDGFDAAEDGNYDHHLIKLSTQEDADHILEDLYDYLKPGHGGHLGKSRKTKPLRPEEISRVKRAINALIKYKRRIESNTVGGPTQA